MADDEMPLPLVLNDVLEDIEPFGSFKYTNEGITAGRTGKCAWDICGAVAVQLMGIQLIIGDQSIVIDADHWPGIDELIVDSVSIEPMGATVASPWSDGPKFDFAKLTVEYKTGAGQKDDDEDKNNNPDKEIKYSVQSVDFSCETLIIPVKVESSVYQGAGNPAGAFKVTSRDVKRHVRIPTISYDLKFNRVLRPDWPTYNDLAGKINTVTMFGGPEGTVLLDGLKADKENTSRGERAWELGFKFIFQRHGWNKTLHPDTLKWVDAKSLDAQNDPYEKGNLRNVIPVQYR